MAITERGGGGNFPDDEPCGARHEPGRPESSLGLMAGAITR
jgi:hypothetical protein